MLLNEAISKQNISSLYKVVAINKYLINIDEVIRNEKNILNLDESEVPTNINRYNYDDITNKVAAGFVLYPSAVMIKHKYNININESFENNKNIIYDEITKSYYYNFYLDTTKYKMIDIIKNINSNYKIAKLYFLHNLEIKCDINKVTLPIVNMTFVPVNLLLKIDKQDIIDINLSFDNYTIENGYRKCFKTSTKYITNDDNIVFKEGHFIGYTN